MESPFSNYTDQATGFDEVSYGVSNEVEARGPFATHAHNCNCGKKHDHELFSDEAISATDMVLGEDSFIPGMEGELTGTEVTTAKAINAGLMMTLQWALHVDAIAGLLKSATGIDAKATGSIQYDVFAKAVDKYQELKKLKPS